MGNIWFQILHLRHSPLEESDIKQDLAPAQGPEYRNSEIQIPLSSPAFLIKSAFPSFSGYSKHIITSPPYTPRAFLASDTMQFLHLLATTFTLLSLTSALPAVEEAVGPSDLHLPFQHHTHLPQAEAHAQVLQARAAIQMPQSRAVQSWWPPPPAP
jgi:hypothetical protein